MVTTVWALSGPISITPAAPIFTSPMIPLRAFSTKILAMENFRRLDSSPALGSVKTVPNKPPCGRVAVGDYNHTGRPSIYTTNFSDEYDDLYRNDGNWNFTDVSYKSGIALPSLPYVKWGTAFRGPSTMMAGLTLSRSAVTSILRWTLCHPAAAIANPNSSTSIKPTVLFVMPAVWPDQRFSNVGSHEVWR